MPPLLKRFLLSLFVAGLTVWMSLEAVYTMNREAIVRRYSTSAGSTRLLTLKRARAYIEQFRGVTGYLPANLREVEKVVALGEYERKTWNIDAWYHPFDYQRKGECFSLISYGHDGKPGGIGLDADIAYGEKKAKNSPTFWQFLTYSDAAFLHPACLIAGFFAFFVGMYASHKDAKEGKKPSSIEMLLSVTLMVGMSVMGAVFMGALDYPSGH